LEKNPELKNDVFSSKRKEVNIKKPKPKEIHLMEEQHKINEALKLENSVKRTSPEKKTPISPIDAVDQENFLKVILIHSTNFIKNLSQSEVSDDDTTNLVLENCALDKQESIISLDSNAEIDSPLVNEIAKETFLTSKDFDEIHNLDKRTRNSRIALLKERLQNQLNFLTKLWSEDEKTTHSENIETNESQENESISSESSTEIVQSSTVNGIDRSYASNQRAKIVSQYEKLVKKYGVEKAVGPNFDHLSEKQFQIKKAYYDMYYKCDGTVCRFVRSNNKGPVTFSEINGKLQKVKNPDCNELKPHYKLFNVHGKRASFESRSIMVCLCIIY
jgi:hypothetical protein